MLKHTRSVRVGSQKATVILETNDALTQSQSDKWEEAMNILARMLHDAE